MIGRWVAAGTLACLLLGSGWEIPPAAAQWEVIQRRDRLVVGVKDNLPPLGFRDRQGALVGFEVEIARQLAQDLLGDASKVELVPLRNAERFEALWEGRVDLVIAQVTLTRNRSRVVTFSPPYYTAQSVVIVPRSRRPEQPPDTIAVLRGSNVIPMVQFHHPQAQTIGIGSYAEGIAALTRGQVSALAGDRLALHQWLIDNPDYTTLAPIGSHSLAIAMPRGLDHYPLHERLSQSVERLRQSGWLRDRAQFWRLP
ncbi:MAG: transporter substrate-binding domain-containing protein [Oscillatoriales cyanobacterium SM2_2_1]|nr:transporter substrate-binding domain-containing protein [Oscillatoriales cyanobacterium SM2_2_1]